MEFGIGQFLAGDAAADADAAEAELLDRVFDLLRGEVGMLQRRGREGDEAVGLAAQNSTSVSFWILISSAATSRSARYQ